MADIHLDPPDGPAKFGPWLRKLLKREAINEGTFAQEVHRACGLKHIRFLNILSGMAPYETEAEDIMVALRARVARIK